MKNKTSIIILIIVAVTLPLVFSQYSNHTEKIALLNSADNSYVTAPSNAKTHKPGLKYVELEAGTNQPVDESQTIVRSKARIWVDGEQQAKDDGDNLDATNPYDLEVSHPFLSEILRASSTGGRYLWWVDGEQISEGTSGFEAKDTMIDITIVDRVAPITAPTDVVAIPTYATISEDGIGYYLLSEPTTGAHPTLADDIKVHYTGWQTDGTMFDSSVLREQPAIFPLGRLIDGWQKAVPLMRVGERARIWIPGNLAYDLRENRPHAPKGMLVFDVELISIPAKTE